MSEPLITLRDAARLPALASAARRPAAGIDVPTLVRYCVAGCRAENGQRIKLESVRIAGKRMTTAAAVARFVSRLNATGPAPLAEADAGKLAHTGAEARLDAEGICEGTTSEA